MTKAQIVAFVQRRLGMRTDLSTEIGLELDVAQLELSKMKPTPWFLKTTGTDVTGTSGAYTLAATFIGFAYHKESIFYTDNTAYRIYGIDYESMRKDLLIRQNVAAARPQNYAVKAGRVLTFWPTPDSSYAIELHYYALDSDPSGLGSSATNLWLTWEPELLGLQTALNIATAIRDVELAGYLEGKVQEKIAALKVTTTDREENPVERVINEELPAYEEEPAA